MLSEYLDISKCLPVLAPEVVHRVVEILKLFNTRTCMRSITSKHLALTSQVISLIYAIITDIWRVLFLKIPESRKSSRPYNVIKGTKKEQVQQIINGVR
ncbi:Vacuolar protein sorting-associated protein 54 C-terminal [Dioscorea alata]|uniref:Vacuolar protein sorting-associated protein 54 C-terminal n=1 Tax=Dioscorea alata TaxID=55571 RepID=A0ACB7VA55_DIOAL|nr:Vacuolar protein sorting-associated protein 54 C-terminal [Dioscorea alata]